jgi:diguanylate cyclase (GGDEF)-like protein/putative nucleotidyltransferase with HDIG domain
MQSDVVTSNIMIIDDSPIDRKVIRQIIEKNLSDVTVFEAEDGYNIQEKIISENIDMCILDIMMPIKDGFSVLKDMKEHCFLKDIPVIVCTGINDNQAIVKALTLGAYDYFAKPLSEEVMKVSLPLKVRNAIELMKRNKEITYLSYHDTLTGMYNRRFYEEQLKRINILENLPISIIMADINGLKLINDTFGHAKGDILLKEATKAIENGCREFDTVARWGGDEFIILMPKTDEEEAQKVVKNIKDKCSEGEVGSIDLSIAFGWDTKTTLEEDIAKVLKNAEDYMYRNKSLESESTRSNMINTIMNTLLEKNPREEMHSKRVSEICKEIGKAMNLSDLDLKKLRVAGLLHDIGKIAIGEGILNKPGKLTHLEWNEIERHPAIGYRILSTSHEMLEIAEFILAHHERWDGTGYPRGLKGESSPLIARIICLADSYDAMTSERSYRSALSEEIVLEEIKKNSGTQFDPKIARIFVEKVLRKQWN